MEWVLSVMAGNLMKYWRFFLWTLFLAVLNIFLRCWTSVEQRTYEETFSSLYSVGSIVSYELSFITINLNLVQTTETSQYFEWPGIPLLYKGKVLVIILFLIFKIYSSSMFASNFIFLFCYCARIPAKIYTHICMYVTIFLKITSISINLEFIDLCFVSIYYGFCSFLALCDFFAFPLSSVRVVKQNPFIFESLFHSFFKDLCVANSLSFCLAVPLQLTVLCSLNMFVNLCACLDSSFLLVLP